MTLTKKEYDDLVTELLSFSFDELKLAMQELDIRNKKDASLVKQVLK